MIETRLLIVEDDPNLGQILKEYLEVKGFKADLAIDGNEGTKLFSKNHYDLCILDIMLPKKDGLSLAKEIKASRSVIPFIFLTAKSLQQDTLRGLQIGADDYVTKPFSMEELLLRIGGILRRTNSGVKFKDQSPAKIGLFEFDYNKQTLTTNDGELRLTSKENDLLLLLYQCKNSVLERKTALKKIWHDDTYFNARSMDVYIAKLRKYLKKDKSVQIITIHGQGFRLVEIN